MIKLKSSKEQILTVMLVIDVVLTDLKIHRAQIPNEKGYAWERMEEQAEISILEDLRSKVQIKYLLMRDKINTHPCTFSLNEMQAYIFIKHTRQYAIFSEFQQLVIEQIKQPICKLLLQ